MKKLKPSKILMLSLAIATVMGGSALMTANAGASSPYNRSVREMMARRHQATVSAKKAGRTGTTSSIFSGPSRMANSALHAGRSAAGPVSLSLASLFDAADKDGSIFPGGPCKNCHNTGPIFDTGTCDRCYKNGPLIDTGTCDRCYQNGPLIDTGPCKKCKEPKPVVIAAPQPEPVCPVCVAPKLTNYAISYNDYVVQAVERDCCAFAPFYLDHVDFNLNQDEDSVTNKMGNYRFRIFGCRRFDKEAILNHGRVMEKDMNLIDIFEQATSECYQIIKKPDDLCLQKTPTPLPEYVLTAEITNFFMNLCDGYDWENSKPSNTRTGRSEMTVTWTLTNLSKTKVLWQGTTTGYAELNLGNEQGEIALVQAAFADASTNLQSMRQFENQLAQRLTPAELTAERQALIDEEIALNPAKCQFAEPLQQQQQCELTRPEADIMACPAFEQQYEILTSPCEMEVEPCPVEIVENSGVVADYEPAQILDNCIDEQGGIVAGGDCRIVDDTWVEADTKAFDSLCITSRAPYDMLSPENLYKVRASVAEIVNAGGKKGAGLIVSDSFVLTSADLADAKDSTCHLKTINGKEFSGRVVRVNPSKNTALVMLDTKTEYTPLALNLDLPKTGQTGFMTLGLLDVAESESGAENYIDNSAQISGYRYSDDKGAEIIVDTNAQDIAIGSVLIDAHGAINGMAHTGQKTEQGKDLFLPTETALRSLGLTVCGYIYEQPSPWQQTVYKPVSQMIQTVQKAPEEMKKENRK